MGWIIASVLLGLFIALPFIERQLVYWPSRTEREIPAAYGAVFEEIVLQSEDRTQITTWVILQEESPETKLWLIYCHGNASNISENLRYPMYLRRELGVNVLMMEYRGFYRSEGAPSEEGLYMDARAHYQYLLDRGVLPQHIVLYGFSLGTGVATQLALEQPVAGLILGSPYTSVPDVARELYTRIIPDRLMRNHYLNEDKVGLLEMPLLILHAPSDKTIPYEHGKTLFEIASHPKTFIAYEGSHNSLASGYIPDNVGAGLKAFIATLRPEN